MYSPEVYVGARVAERYVLKQPLGRGGFGVVLGADDEQTHAQVAVKLMENAEVMAEEVDIMRRVYHPNVVSVFGHGRAEVLFPGSSGRREEHSFVSMMWANNGSVADLLRRRSAGLSTADSVAILSQTTKGVQDAHDLGIVHRDLKPENLLIHQFFPEDRDRQVLVTDFGTARRQLTDDTLIEAGAGTPFYMPSEAFGKSVRVSPTLDIYAAGVIGYQLLTGKLPYKSKNIWVLAGEHYRGDAASFEMLLDNRMTDVHAALEPVVRRAMDPIEANRYASIEDYGEELRTTYHDAIGSDRGTVIFEMTTKPSPKRPATPAPVLTSEPQIPFHDTTGGLDLEKILPSQFRRTKELPPGPEEPPTQPL